MEMQILVIGIQADIHGHGEGIYMGGTATASAIIQP